MTCEEFRVGVHAYVDGELSSGDTVAADAHAAACEGCRRLAHGERGFRRLLRRQAWEPAPPEFRARLVAALGRARRRSFLRKWAMPPVLAATVAALVVAILLPLVRPAPSLLDDLVETHIAYARLGQPVELASPDPQQVEGWLERRADLRVTVPDFSPAGIHLLGARLAAAGEQTTAYLLYEKGRVLLSVFIVPLEGRDVRLPGTTRSYRGKRYVVGESRGFHTVTWSDGHAVFALVSALDDDAMLQCAGMLRRERERQTRL